MTQPDTYHQIAHRYAPIFAQKVSKEWVVADQIAPVDFAGSILAVVDNPKKLYGLPDDALIPAKVYYSVCETTTHYFLIYAVYHVLDWWKRYTPSILDFYNTIRDRYDEHVHDMEGALLVVTKEPAGLVDGVVTLAHGNFYLYTEPMLPTDVGDSKNAFEQSLHVVKFNENVDGNIWIDRDTKRVKLYIESRGHGIYGDHKRWGSGDGIWYYGPKVDGTAPGTLDANEKPNTKAITYELEDIFAPNGLWAHRFKDRVFRQNKDGMWGFAYRNPKTNRFHVHGSAANPPWTWNDRNDPSPIGEIATDPARCMIRYAQGWGPVSTQYLYNPYQAIFP